MIVVDASVLVNAFGDDGERGSAAREAISGERIVAPSMFDLETISAWRRHIAHGHMSTARGQRAVHDLRRLSVQCPPHAPLIPRIWQLRENLTVYDATYVAMAERFSAKLLTADKKMANAPGARCEFQLID